jgi:uncharacterized protein
MASMGLALHDGRIGWAVEWQEASLRCRYGTGSRPRRTVEDLMSLKDRLREDLNQARRDKDRSRTTVLTTTLSEVRNREIELGRAATDEDVTAVVARAIKQRRESAEQMRSGGRPELADREEGEAELLKRYMPESMDEGSVRALVRDAIAAGASDMGAVMGVVMPRIRGRFDGREANRIVGEELG